MKKGFTLMELLIVVLIIAILAAIALPQYEKMVERTASTEAIITLKAVGESIVRTERVKSAKLGVNAWDHIDVLPPGDYDSSAKTYTTAEFQYGVGSNTNGTYVYAKKLKAPLYNFEQHIIGNELQSTFCSYTTGDVDGEDACRQAGFLKTVTVASAFSGTSRLGK